jgi:site-specific recombinase XerD
VAPRALRHTFGTRYLETGSTLAELPDILGHANVATTDRYSILGHANVATTDRYSHANARSMQEVVEGL